MRDRVLEAAEYIPLTQLGTTDDCGFAPFSDDTSTGRDTAFGKIRARVVGTELAASKLQSLAAKGKSKGKSGTGTCEKIGIRPLIHTVYH